MKNLNLTTYIRLKKEIIELAQNHEYDGKQDLANQLYKTADQLDQAWSIMQRSL